MQRENHASRLPPRTKDSPEEQQKDLEVLLLFSATVYTLAGILVNYLQVGESSS